MRLNDLPEFSLELITGRGEPALRMCRRDPSAFIERAPESPRPPWPPKASRCLLRQVDRSPLRSYRPAPIIPSTSASMAVRAGVSNVVSIESDRLWLDAVKAKLATCLNPDRHHLRHVDIGPTARFGYPATRQLRDRFQRYALEPWEFCGERTLGPDLVLIDGRFRVACFLRRCFTPLPAAASSLTTMPTGRRIMGFRLRGAAPPARAER